MANPDPEDSNDEDEELFTAENFKWKKVVILKFNFMNKWYFNLNFLIIL